MSKTAKIVILAAAFVTGACGLACALAAFVVFRYQPAVVAAPGYDMAWPTRPGPAASVVKSYQRFFEIRPCEVTLLGWSAGGILYYREACRESDPRVWAYDPEAGGRPSRIDASPADLLQEIVPRRSILEWVRSPQVLPADAEPDVRALEVRVDGLASPEGRWVAVVVRHVYGPVDVIVLGD